LGIRRKRVKGGEDLTEKETHADVVIISLPAVKRGEVI
jgi:hypothetical protein